MRKSTPLFCALLLSLSARRAWIEIAGDRHVAHDVDVALRKESVDRNSAGACHRAAAHASLSARRAWIEMQVPVFGGRGHGSLSARRAWIEIPKRIKFCAICYVALRKESVDRNGHGVFILILGLGSLSARRAWIEIVRPLPIATIKWSLSARRAWIEILPFQKLGQ